MMVKNGIRTTCPECDEVIPSGVLVYRETKFSASKHVQCKSGKREVKKVIRSPLQWLLGKLK